MDRLSPLDVSFLHMEDADHTAHMHIASIGIFEGPPPPQDAFRDALANRMHLIPRYRQRVQRVPFDLARPVWVDAADFDVDYHLRRTAVAAPGGDKELRELYGRLMSQRLDRTKPLWEIWIVEGLAEDRWAAVSKVHHAMVDGVSGAEVMATILDVSPETVIFEPVPWNPRTIDDGELVTDALRSLATDTGEQLRAVRSAMRRPGEVLGQARGVLTGVRSMSTAVQAQGDTELTGAVGSHRVIAWTHAPLEDIKTVRSSLGGTVNDVVLTAITNGFRQLLLARGEPVEGRTVRSLVPVSVRATREDGAATGDGTLNNKVSTMFASLPVGVADPAERLATVRKDLDGLKESNQALAGEALTAISAVAPAALLALGARVAARGVATGPTPVQTVTTNVPGPPIPLYSLGRELLRVYPFVPVVAPVRISVSIFSYNGEVTWSVTGDRDTASDVDLVAEGIADGLAELVDLATSAKPVKPAKPAKATNEAKTANAAARKTSATS